MSDAPAVFTSRSAPRAELAKFFVGNPRLVKAFEDLLTDVSVTLPNAIGNTSEDAASVLAQAAFLPPPPAAIAASAPDASLVMAQHSFTQPPPQAQPVNDSAGQILASQIFGA